MSFAKWVKTQREGAGLSQVDLASRLAMSPRSIIRIEAGEKTTKRTVRALAVMFGEEPDRLQAMHDGRKIPDPARGSKCLVEMSVDAYRVIETLSAEAGVSISEYCELLAKTLIEPLAMTVRHAAFAATATAGRASADRRGLFGSSPIPQSEPVVVGAETLPGGKTRFVR